MDCSTPGLPVHHQLPEFAQIHVHWVSDAIQPSHPLSSPSPLPSIFPASGSFQMSQFFASGAQGIGASAPASVLPVNIQNIQNIQWFPLGWTGFVRDQTTVSRTWVMFTRKRQDMRSSCLANHVTPATLVTETKNCLYISRHTPLFGALVRFLCVGWDLGPSALGINKLCSCVCNTVVDLLSRLVQRYRLEA